MKPTESTSASTSADGKHWVSGAKVARKSERRLSGLDGLRAFSILLVVAHHILFIRDGGSDNFENRFPYGRYGVYVFFVISGFLITYLLCDEEKKTSRISLKRFYWHRVFRILPPALLYLSITAPLSSRSSLLHSVFFVRNLFPGEPINWHFWSLSVEEQFYLVWPLIFVVLRGNRKRFAFLITALALIPTVKHLAVREWGLPPDSIAGMDVTHSLIFGAYIIFQGQAAIICGCAPAIAREIGMARRPWLVNGYVAMCFLAVAIGLAVADKAVTVVFILIALIINWSVSQKSSFLDWAPLVWIGQLSYSLYLWQQVFCFKSPLQTLGRFPLNVVLSLAAAMLSFYFVEKPALRLRDRLKRRFSAADLRQAPAVS